MDRQTTKTASKLLQRRYVSENRRRHKSNIRRIMGMDSCPSFQKAGVQTRSVFNFRSSDNFSSSPIHYETSASKSRNLFVTPL